MLTSQWELGFSGEEACAGHGECHTWQKKVLTGDVTGTCLDQARAQKQLCLMTDYLPKKLVAYTHRSNCINSYSGHDADRLTDQ